MTDKISTNYYQISKPVGPQIQIKVGSNDSQDRDQEFTIVNKA